jgi:hypothetical protein
VTAAVSDPGSAETAVSVVAPPHPSEIARHTVIRTKEYRLIVTLQLPFPGILNGRVSAALPTGSF